MSFRNRKRNHQVQGSRGKRSGELQKRIRDINNCVLARDVDGLRALALSRNGLVNAGLRRLAWPLLLHVDADAEWSVPEEAHSDEPQVSLDVARSMNHIPQVARMESKSKRQKQLHEIIVSIFRRNPSLRYYQVDEVQPGFHDVCSCLLLNLGPKTASRAAENAALFFLRDAMTESLEPILAQLNLLYPLLEQEDYEVWQYLQSAMVPPYFCLSWVLTWCSHDIWDLEKMSRLFDFFLASNPLMPLYLVAAVIASRREELLNEVECEYASVHTFLSRFPQNADLEGLISHSRKLFITVPPEELQRRSGKLSERSSVNTYHTTFLSVPLDERLPYAEVRKLLIPRSTGAAAAGHVKEHAVAGTGAVRSTALLLKGRFLRAFIVPKAAKRKGVLRQVSKLAGFDTGASASGYGRLVAVVVLSAFAGAWLAAEVWRRV